MSIYTTTQNQISSFEPTYLYIKRHKVSGKLYFGKHIASSISDILKYNGSGTYWVNHINKYGRTNVETLWYCLYTDVNDIMEFALTFSQVNDIANSKKWANQQSENGLGGASKGCKGRIGSWDHINNNKSLYLKTKEEYRTIFNKSKVNGIHPVNSRNSILKSQNTCLRKYGFSNISQVEEIKLIKFKKFQLSKITIDHNTNKTLYELWLERIKNTTLENYGETCIFKTDYFKNKVKQECFDEHGVEYHQSRPEVRAKIGEGNTGKVRTKEMKDNLRNKMSNRVTAKDIRTNEIVNITKQEYDSNTEIYVGTTAKQRTYINRETGELLEMYSSDIRVKTKQFRLYQYPIGKGNYLTSSQMVVCCLECKQEIKKNVFSRHLKKH